MSQILDADASFWTLIQGTMEDGVQYLSDIYDIISSNPLLSAIAVIALVATGIIVTHYIIKMLQHESDRFLEVISDCDSITVLMHDNPDPDAMACAMAVQRLAETEDVKTQIAYPGKISHDENRAFRAVLDVSFDNISRPEQIEGDKIVLVDQSQPRGIENGERLVPNAIIDHHPTTGLNEEDIEFVKIDDTIGACSSILTKFLNEQDLVDPTGENTDISENLATALYHGIKSDTNDISQGVSSVDFEAVNLLYNNIDEEKLHRISNPKVDGNSLETKARAIMGREVRGPFAVSDVGDVQNTDAIPQAADELIRLEGISAAVVLGACDGSIRLSGRAYDDRIHLGDALERAVQELCTEGGAGGHAQMAGGQIPKKSLDEGEFSRSDIIEKLFDVMNGREV